MKPFRLTLACQIIGAFATLANPGSAHAAPFSIRYDGVAGYSEFPDTPTGTPYSVTLVVDNGGTSAADQTWSSAQLRCVIWRTGSAGPFIQNLVGAPPTTALGNLSTDGDGNLTSMFTEITQTETGVPNSAIVYAGSGLVPWIYWNIKGASDPADILSDAIWKSLRDANGGVSVDLADWTAPQAANDLPAVCPGPLVAPNPGIEPVPAISSGGLGWLAAGLSTVAALLRRRQRR